jgi:hypothetical protein
MTYIKILIIIFISIFFVSIPLYALDVPFVSQHGWKGYLGNRPIMGSIDRYGCALACTTMVFKHYGIKTDPEKLNTWLSNPEHFGYESDGAIRWYIAMGHTAGMIEQFKTSGASLGEIENELSKGYPVIAKVISPSAPMHFIVFTIKEGDKYYFLDPWDGNKTGGGKERVWPEGSLGEYTLKGLRIFYGEKNKEFYADGTLIKADAPEVYIMYDRQKWHIPDPETFKIMGYDWGKIQNIKEEPLRNIPTGYQLPHLRNGILIKGTGPEVYVIEYEQKHHIPNRETFESKGYKWNDIIKIPDWVLGQIPGS